MPGSSLRQPPGAFAGHANRYPAAYPGTDSHTNQNADSNFHPHTHGYPFPVKNPDRHVYPIPNPYAGTASNRHAYGHLRPTNAGPDRHAGP
jgi:hypothetical protein